MKLVPPTPTVKAPTERFTGDVYLNPLHNGEAPSRLVAAMVRFTPGARTNWHSHPLGQTLHCTDGTGFVATRDGSVILMRAGDTVHTPPRRGTLARRHPGQHDVPPGPGGARQRGERHLA
ncbi:cupin 2, barrel domain protein [Arthrobacter sp. Hiyo1]|uniref:cupin domain-containing protein n=1 Tax=Arthrobacter sp. Hiyo1 TaxID=1588020 RepID=UPI0007231D22|nr:cupin 2, barrel domain protein [Arthrobacter sp. Hiyo1]